MTDYNDGKWHGWNGGECPVHPKSVVEWTRFTGIGVTNVPYQGMAPAESAEWDVLTAFRVIKPYRAPREWWLTRNGWCWVNAGTAWKTYAEAKGAYNDPDHEIIRVREVTDD